MNLSEVSQDKQPKKTSYEAIAYRELRNAILTGIFPPGYQVVEEYISSQLNMSRSLYGALSNVLKQRVFWKNGTTSVSMSLCRSSIKCLTFFIFAKH